MKLLNTNINSYIIVAFLTVSSLLCMTQANAWSYPIDEVSKPKAECKSKHRDDLDDTCKMKLPIISNADYSKYLKDRTKQSIYSDVR